MLVCNIRCVYLYIISWMMHYINRMNKEKNDSKEYEYDTKLNVKLLVVWSHSFFVITLGFTLTQSCCTCQSFIYELNKCVWKFLVPDKNTWNHITVKTARLSDSQQKKKENLPNSGLCRSDWPQGKTEGRQKERFNNSGPYLRIEKLWNMKVIVIPVVIDAFGIVTKGFVQGL